MSSKGHPQGSRSSSFSTVYKYLQVDELEALTQVNVLGKIGTYSDKISQA